MEALAVALIMWATTTQPPLTVVYYLVGGAGTLVAIWLGVSAWKQRRSAGLRQQQYDIDRQQLDGVQVSIKSLESALAQANRDIKQLRRDLDAEREQCATDRAASADRIRVLVAQIVDLGGTPESERR